MISCHHTMPPDPKSTIDLEGSYNGRRMEATCRICNVLVDSFPHDRLPPALTILGQDDEEEARRAGRFAGLEVD